MSLDLASGATSDPAFPLTGPLFLISILGSSHHAPCAKKTVFAKTIFDHMRTIQFMSGSRNMFSFS